MAAERKCRYCLYWHSRLPGRTEPKDDTVGECRFNPPSYYPSAVGSHRISEKQGVWPETYGRDWCGQFSLDRWPRPGGTSLRPPALN